MPRSKLLLNLALNLLVSAFFVTLNFYAFRAGFEETFIFLALVFGLITTLANLLFFAFFSQNRQRC